MLTNDELGLHFNIIIITTVKLPFKGFFFIPVGNATSTFHFVFA